MGNGGNGVQGVWAIWAMGPMGNVETGGKGVQGIWGTWPMRPTAGMGYRVWATWAIVAQGVWGTRGMGHMGNRSHGQWATWAMGPMGHGAYGQWGPWAISTFLPDNFINTGWILTKILLDIDIDVFLSKYRAIFPRWLELKHISMDFKFCLLAGGCPGHLLARESSPHYIFTHAHDVITVSIYSNRKEGHGKPFHFEFSN